MKGKDPSRVLRRMRIKFFLILSITFMIAFYMGHAAHSLALYAFVTLPGTFFHELAHYLTALVLDGRPQNFNLIPTGNTLGSVVFYPNWYNAAPVGLAPLLLAPFTFLMAAIATRTCSVFKTILFSYFAACSWVACTPSPQDFSIAMAPTSWPTAILFLGLTGFLMYKTTRFLIRT